MRVVTLFLFAASLVIGNIVAFSAADISMSAEAAESVIGGGCYVEESVICTFYQPKPVTFCLIGACTTQNGVIFNCSEKGTTHTGPGPDGSYNDTRDYDPMRDFYGKDDTSPTGTTAVCGKKYTCKDKCHFVMYFGWQCEDDGGVDDDWHAENELAIFAQFCPDEEE